MGKFLKWEKKAINNFLWPAFPTSGSAWRKLQLARFYSMEKAQHGESYSMDSLQWSGSSRGSFLFCCGRWRNEWHTVLRRTDRCPGYNMLMPDNAFAEKSRKPWLLRGLLLHCP
jgi:hypothetical protein